MLILDFLRDRQGSLPKTKPQPLRHEEHTPTHLDDPTRVDQLNRRPFADVMAIRIREIWDLGRQTGSLPTEARVKTEPMSSEGFNSKKGELSSTRSNDHRSLAVHLHGPWGAGKTSVMNFTTTTAFHTQTIKQENY